MTRADTQKVSRFSPIASLAAPLLSERPRASRRATSWEGSQLRGVPLPLGILWRENQLEDPGRIARAMANAQFAGRLRAPEPAVILHLTPCCLPAYINVATLMCSSFTYPMITHDACL